MADIYPTKYNETIRQIIIDNLFPLFALTGKRKLDIRKGIKGYVYKHGHNDWRMIPKLSRDTSFRTIRHILRKDEFYIEEYWEIPSLKPGLYIYKPRN